MSIALAAVLAPAAGMAAPGAPACAMAKPGSAPGAYPTFCSIPRTPTDIRGPAAYKAAVVDTRLAGRRLARQTAPETFGLPAGEAAAFSRSAQAEAAPPPEVSSSSAADTAAFAAEARRKASPPPKSRR